jgi:signal transduction histidine kinase/CheY-like chemotaxis protein
VTHSDRPNENAPALDALVRAEAIKQIFENMPAAIFTSASASVFVAIAFRNVASVAAWGSWLFLMTVHLAARWMLVRAYRRSQPSVRQLPYWGLAAAAGATFAGILWGVSIPLLAPAGNFEYEFFLVLVVGTLGFAAALSSATYLPALFGFFLPSIVPLPLHMLAEPEGLRLIIGMMYIVYIPVFTRFAFITRERLLQSIRLSIEKANLAEQLAERTAAAEAATIEKSRFLAAASHDLRQPMHALTLFVEALRAQSPTEAQTHLIDKIGDSLAAMDGLFHALLDISRLDAGVVKPEISAFPIQELLDRIALAFAGPAGAKQLKLSVRPSTIWVQSDRLLCERILHNLVANAVQYTSSGGVVVACRRRASHVVVQVWDSGPGIPSGAREEIFKEFVQLDNPERDRRKGLGLGLAIVRRLARLLDAPLALSTAEQRGSCFSFSLPIASPLESRAAERSLARDTEVLIDRTVAVVDDEGQVRDAMEAVLRSWQVKVISAGSGNELIDILNRDNVLPDALICDYRLRNNVSGIDVIEAVREEFNRDFPALLVTGDTAPDRLIEAEHSGLPLLHKPVQPKQFKCTLAALLRPRRQRPLQQRAVATLP